MVTTGELELASGGRDSVLALDVGGSHLSAARFDFGSLTLGEVGHVRVPAGGSADDFLDMLQKLCREIVPLPAPIAGLAAAMPNPFDCERGISFMKHKFQQLYGADLREAMSRRLGCYPADIYFLNDAAAYLVGELRQGAAVGIDRAVGITLGTGIGSAFAVHGHTVVDGAGVPPGGEIWDLAYLGGIVEDFAGTVAIQRLHLERTGVQAEVREIAMAAAEGDLAARKTFEQFGVQLGRLLRFTTAEFGPQRIVVGGGIARSSALFFPAAQRELADLNIDLRVSQLSDRAPLIGAAMSWRERLL
jgi:glucokinase